MRLFFPSLLALIILSGCVTPVSQSNLYWGKYSQTLYQVKKEPGVLSNQSHENELLSIVDESKTRNLKVPPGVYAELGIFALGRGDDIAAANYFRMEQDVYPEAAILMQRSLGIQPGEI